MKTSTHFLSYLPEFCLERGTFSIKVVEKITTDFLFNNVFPKIVPFIMWKNTAKLNMPQMTIQNGACSLHAG